MKNSCVQCGVRVPSGQRVCSMCYGDIHYGRDGYYRRWAEEQEQEERERRAAPRNPEETNGNT